MTLEKSSGVLASAEQASSGGGLPSIDRQEPRGSASSSAEGHMGEARSTVPAEQTRRCGPWVDGVCQKCGRLDPLDLIDYFEED